VGVAYGSDLAKVLELLLLAAAGSEKVLKDPAPSAIFTAFGNSSIDFELRVWVSDISWRQVVRSELGQEVDRRFREAIPIDHLTHNQDENTLLQKVFVQFLPPVCYTNFGSGSIHIGPFRPGCL
jgi:small-conductance mechanosensitive channel